MKTGKIIKKNMKLLLRSRISTLVLIFGPLIVILLVGISFSTSSFNLNMGVYSEKYSNLSNSLVDTLREENYAVTKFPAQKDCIDSVKVGQTHACIVFPPDLTIDNENSNVVQFHVDQSKINLVYLVMSTLTSSFEERSSEISRGLTNNIVSTLFDTKEKLSESEKLVAEIIETNNQIITDSQASITSLDDLDFSSGDIDVGSSIEDLKSDIDSMVDSSTELVEDGLEVIEDLEDYDIEEDNETTQSGYDGDVDDLKTALLDLNESLEDGRNTTYKQFNKFSEDVADEFGDVVEKLETAGNVNDDVVVKLKSLKERSEEIRDRSESLQTKIDNMVSSINAVQITNSDKIVSPIDTKINPIVQNQSNLGFLFPSLIVMLIMFIGLLLPSTLVIMEKNSKAAFRVFTTPTKGWLFVVATFFTGMILILFQVFIILAVSQFYFNINFLHSFFLLFLSLIIITTFFILLGMLIGYIFNSEELAMLASISLGSLFLLTSGIIFPLESMPSYIIDKAKFNPVVLGSDLFKRSILFGTDFGTVKGPLGYLILFSSVVILIIFLVNKVKRIEAILKKPSKLKIKKDWLKNQFDFGERKAKTLPEFIVSIQNLSQDKFSTLQEQNAVRDWLIFIYKNKYLAKKIEQSKSKKELVAVLVQELKEISEKQNQDKQK